MALPHSHLLLPPNRGFMALSLVLAFLLNCLPWGHAAGIPDFLALALVFWNVHYPRLLGIGIAFLFGLLMDVQEAALFGEHSLAYAVLCYGAMGLHRRVPWFGMPAQVLHVLPLFFIAQVVTLVVRMIVGGAFPGWLWFLQCVATALLWPAADWLLLAPQRRALHRDESRSL